MLLKYQTVQTLKCHILQHQSVFIIANSADPDEMPYLASFHLGLHVCKSTCARIFRYSIQRVNLSSSLDLCDDQYTP